jgi:phage gpG-like protein
VATSKQTTAHSGAAFVSIQAPDAELVSRRLRRYAQGIEDARPAFELMVRVMRQSEQAVFDTEGGAIGRHWPAAAEPDRKQDSRLLVATGALMRSLTGQTGDSNVQITAKRLTYGTTVPYGRFHEYGGRVPARPFIGLSQTAARDLINVMHDYSVKLAESRLP